MEITRRSLVTGLAGLLCAPAIVRASSLMPVKPIPPAIDFRMGTWQGLTWVGCSDELLQDVMNDLVSYGSCVVHVNDDGMATYIPPSEWHDLSAAKS